MVQPVKHLPCRHKILHLIHKIHVNLVDMVAPICNASIGLALLALG